MGEILKKINFAGKLPANIDDKKIYLDGIKGSALAFYSATLFSKFPKNQIIICNDREAGLYLYNDLQLFTTIFRLYDNVKILYKKHNSSHTFYFFSLFSGKLI